MGKQVGRPVTNKHKVPRKMWVRWSRLAQKVFNQVYHEMRPRRQWVFLHPQAKPTSAALWQTTRWNAACTAADAANGDPPLTKIIPVKSRRRR